MALAGVRTLRKAQGASWVTREGPHGRGPSSSQVGRQARWSADGKTLYFLAADSSFIHLWAAHFNPVRGVVVGEPVQLTHFDAPSFKISPSMTTTEMDVGGRFLTMESTSGNVWMLDNVVFRRGYGWARSWPCWRRRSSSHCRRRAHCGARWATRTRPMPPRSSRCVPSIRAALYTHLAIAAVLIGLTARV